MASSSSSRAGPAGISRGRSDQSKRKKNANSDNSEFQQEKAANPKLIIGTKKLDHSDNGVTLAGNVENKCKGKEMYAESRKGKEREVPAEAEVAAVTQAQNLFVDAETNAYYEGIAVATLASMALNSFHGIQPARHYFFMDLGKKFSFQGRLKPEDYDEMKKVVALAFSRNKQIQDFEIDDRQAALIDFNPDKDGFVAEDYGNSADGNAKFATVEENGLPTEEEYASALAKEPPIMSDAPAQEPTKKSENHDMEQQVEQSQVSIKLSPADLEISRNVKEHFETRGIHPSDLGYIDQYGLHPVGLSYEAYFLDSETHAALVTKDGILGSISMNVAQHMTTMCLQLEPRAPKRAKVETELEDNDDGKRKNKKFTHYQIDPPEQEKAIVRAHLHWESYKLMHITPLNNMDILDEKLKAEIAKLPQSAHDFISNCKAVCSIPYIVHIRLDASKLRSEKLRLGRPSWAQAFAEGVMSGTIKMIVQGTSGTAKQLCTIDMIFARDRSQVVKKRKGTFVMSDPLRFWHENPGRMVFKADKMNLKREAPNHGYTKRYSFAGMAEYCTVRAIAMTQINSHISKKVTAYNESEHQIRYVTIDNQKSRRYGLNKFIGFLDLLDSEESTMRLSPGDRLKIIHDNLKDPDFNVDGWHAVVCQPIPYAPQEYIPLVVTRKVKTLTKTNENGTSESYVWDPAKVNYITNDFVQELSMNRAVKDCVPNIVRIQIIESDTVYKQNFKCLDSLYHPPNDREEVPWQVDARTLLPAQHLDHLPVHNGWACLTEEFPEFWENLQPVNAEQKEAYKSLTEARGRIGIVDGPPGTGKTHFYKLALGLMFTAKKKHLAVVITSANDAVDNIAEGLDVILKQGQADGTIPANRYGCRVHSKQSEKTIEKSLAISQHQPMDKLPYIDGDDENNETAIIDDLGFTAKILQDVVIKTETREHEGIRDPRVHLLMMSPSITMLKIAGIIPDKHLTEHNKWDNFVLLYVKFSREQQLSDEEKKNFGQESLRLYQYTVQNASFIVATTTGLASSETLDAIRKVVRIMVQDEAMREPEDNMLPIFDTGFEKLDLLLMVGDWRQLGPGHQEAKLKHMPYHTQLDLCLPSRLSRCGMPVQHFVEQNRMVPDISKIANELMYHGTLRNAPSTDPFIRPLSSQFRLFVSAMYDKYSEDPADKSSNVLAINFQGKATGTLISNSKSKFNEAYIIFVGNDLLKYVNLLPATATWAVLTPYVEERNRLLALKTAMELAGIPKHQLDRIYIGTIDSAQGREWDYTVCLLTTDENIGFVGDPRRLTVMFTRAKHGMIVLMNSNTVQHAKSDKKGLVKAQRLISATCIAVTVDKLPVCQFYQPSRPQKGFTYQSLLESL